MDNLIIISGILLVLFIAYLAIVALRPNDTEPKPAPKPREKGPEMDQTESLIDVLSTRTKGHFLNEEMLQDFLQQYGRGENNYDQNDPVLKALLAEVRRNFTN